MGIFVVGILYCGRVNLRLGITLTRNLIYLLNGGYMLQLYFIQITGYTCNFNKSIHF